MFGISILFLSGCALEQIHINTNEPLTFEKVAVQSNEYLYYPYEIIEHDGGYAICGSRYEKASQKREGFLVLIDSLGIFRHEREEKAQIHSMVPIELGFMTTGYNGKNSQDRQLFVKSFIQVQGQPFEPTYIEIAESVGYDLIQTRDGNFLVAGYTTQNASKPALLMKLGPFVESETIWKKTFAPEGNNSFRAFYHIEEKSDGSLIAFDGINILFLDEDGNLQNTVTLENYFNIGSFHKAFLLSKDGDFIIANNRNLSIDLPSSLIKFNASGQEEIRKEYGNLYRFEALRPTLDGGYVVCGSTREFGNGGSDAFLLKVDAELNQEWFRTYGGALDEYAYDAIQTSDGGFMVIGSDQTISQSDALSGDTGLLVVKTDSEGVVR